MKVVLVDDHVLLRNGLASLVKNLGYDVIFEADNGLEFIRLLEKNGVPDIVLMDINMPEMDGYDTTDWLKKNHPDVKVLALSMYDDENAVIRMLKAGAKGYILKDTEPTELRAAMSAIQNRGFYHSDMVTGRLINSITKMEEENTPVRQVAGLTERELEFLKLAASELTYKEIAEQMYLSPRTIDGYRDALFEKLELKSRVGLVLFAIKNGVVKI